jgi:hypothetical protein
LFDLSLSEHRDVTEITARDHAGVPEPTLAQLHL